jgi:hypothetical protein
MSVPPIDREAESFAMTRDRFEGDSLIYRENGQERAEAYRASRNVSKSLKRPKSSLSRSTTFASRSLDLLLVSCSEPE